MTATANQFQSTQPPDSPTHPHPQHQGLCQSSLSNSLTPTQSHPIRPSRPAHTRTHAHTLHDTAHLRTPCIRDDAQVLLASTSSPLTRPSFHRCSQTLSPQPNHLPLTTAHTTAPSITQHYAVPQQLICATANVPPRLCRAVGLRAGCARRTGLCTQSLACPWFKISLMWSAVLKSGAATPSQPHIMRLRRR